MSRAAMGQNLAFHYVLSKMEALTLLTLLLYCKPMIT